MNQPPKLPKFSKPVFPPLPGKSLGQMPFIKQFNTLNPGDFEQMLKEGGVRMHIMKPMPCPAVRDIQGTDHAPSCEFCQNGFRYFDERSFIGAFISNSSQRKFTGPGALDFDSAQLIVPTVDEKGHPLDVSFFDRIVVDVKPVRYYQRMERSQSQWDRLHFPVIKLIKIIGSDMTEYVPGTDCVIDQYGRIEWRGNQPKFDLSLSSGEIYSVVYEVKPVYTVLSIPHQTRSSQVQGPGGPGTTNEQARYPSVVTVRREIVPHSSKQGMSDVLPPPEPR